MSLSNADVSQSFAAAMAAANAGGMHSAGASSSGGHPGLPGGAGSASSAATASLAGQQAMKLNQELLIDTRAANDARDKVRVAQAILNYSMMTGIYSSLDHTSLQDYTSTFEAISPTPNDESQLAEVQLQREKEELLAGINSLEREISKMTSHIDTLHKKKVSLFCLCCALELTILYLKNELEEMTSKPPGDGEENKQKAEPKEPTIEQKIYSANNVS